MTHRADEDRDEALGGTPRPTTSAPMPGVTATIAAAAR
jgi:hypothetical protein